MNFNSRAQISLDYSKQREMTPMRYFAMALVLAVTGAATAAQSADAIPDIKGTWTGKGKVLVYGNNVHNPGSQTMAEPPRVRDIEMTDVVEGQEGRLAWGRSSSKTMDTKDHLPGRSRQTTKRSSAPTRMAISKSCCSDPTRWTSATCIVASVRANRSWPPVTRCSARGKNNRERPLPNGTRRERYN
jgi:hypothetical protein